MHSEYLRDVVPFTALLLVLLRATSPAQTEVQYGLVFDTANGFMYSFGHLGLLRSADEGRTWKRLPLNPDANFVYAMTMVPGDPKRLFIAQQRKNSSMQALLESTDAGISWDTLIPPKPVQWYGALTVSDATGSLILGTDNGLFRYRYKARQWSELMPHVEWGISAAAVSEADTDVVYAAVRYIDGGTFRGRLLRSSDGGVSWVSVLDSAVTPIHGLYLDPTDGQHLFVQYVLIRESADGGSNWSTVDFPENIIASAYHQESERWYIGSLYDEYFATTTNRGETWKRFPCPDDSFLSKLVIDPRNPCRVFMIRVGGMFESRDCGETWSRNGFVPTRVVGPQGASSPAVLSLSAFPNPVAVSTGARSVSVVVQTHRRQVLSLRIHDLLGRIVRARSPLEIEAGTTSIVLSMDGMPPGIYVLYADDAAGILIAVL